MVSGIERNHDHEWKVDSIQLLLAKVNVKATYVCRRCQGVKTKNIHLGYPSKMAMPDEDVMALRKANKAARIKAQT